MARNKRDRGRSYQTTDGINSSKLLKKHNGCFCPCSWGCNTIAVSGMREFDKLVVFECVEEFTESCRNLVYLMKTGDLILDHIFRPSGVYNYNIYSKKLLINL